MNPCPREQERREQIAAQYGVPVERVTICPAARIVDRHEVLESALVQALVLRPAAKEAERRRRDREKAKARAAQQAAKIQQVMNSPLGRLERVALAHRLGLSVEATAGILELSEKTINETLAHARECGRLQKKEAGKPIDIEEVRRLAEEGLTAEQAATRLGRSKSRLLGIAKDNGFSFVLPDACGQKWTRREIELFKEMRASGVSLSRCAARLNRSVGSIRHAARRLV